MDNWDIYNYFNRVDNNPLVNTSTVSATSVNVGGTVTITGKASGGTAPYKYAFYYRRSNTSSWTVKGTEYGTATTATLLPGYADTYQVKVNVKDSKGTIKSKVFYITSMAKGNTTMGLDTAGMFNLSDNFEGE